MATDLETRKSSNPSDAYLQRKFAELCARIQRADLFASLLILALVISTYGVIVGLFDWFAGNSTASSVQVTRWGGFFAFVALMTVLLVRAGQSFFRRVNPYYVAHQIETNIPDAKNILINWLDMRDAPMPTAFQRNLSARAAEQLEESDAEKMVKNRKNWILLASLALPALGLLTLLLLGPSAFAASMLRAFVPFYTPPPIARTHITLLQPEAGNAEVSPTQSMTFIAKIEGRVPVGTRSDAPKLSYRYQASEDYLSQPLQQDKDGLWATQLHSAQIRTGFFYKVSAGDAETSEYEVRVRTRAHVKQFDGTYHHRPYRKLPKTATITFPNQNATKPIIHGPRGSEVELIVHTSRPAKTASIEILIGNAKKEHPGRKLDHNTFSFRWSLEQSGQFRVLFRTTDGEDNTDRDWYPIDVPTDDAPRVVLSKPGKDVKLPVNGTLELEGTATSEIGVKKVTLHLRVIQGAKIDLTPRVYRPGKSFEVDGQYPDVIEYLDVVPLDQFKNDKGTITYLSVDSVIEYWLEAADCTDTPSPTGNIGKSAVYKITLTPVPADGKQQERKREAAQAQQKKHEQKQDESRSKENKGGAQKSNDGQGSRDPQQQFDDANKAKKEAEEKIQKALKDRDEQKNHGNSKSSDDNSSTNKDGSPDSAKGQHPKEKERPMTPPDDAGNNKDQGDNKNPAGGSKDSGAPKDEKPKDGESKGDSKNGPKESPGGAKDGGDKGTQPSAGGAKDGGEKGANAPMPQDAKQETADNGEPTAAARGESQPQGNAKGVDKNGPEASPKNTPSASQPPEATGKGGMMSEVTKGEPKQGSPDAAKQPGNARGDDSKATSKEPQWIEVAEPIAQLADRGAMADEAGKFLAGIVKDSDDPRKSDIAKEALEKYGRDLKTGKEEKKGPSPLGSAGKSPGLSDELKAAAANREFAARIGQMQFDDWRKQMTPDLLKKAGLTEEEWQNYAKSMQSYDTLVRQLNAKLARDSLNKDKIGRANSNVGIQKVESTGAGKDPLVGRALVPPELRDAVRRFAKPSP